MSYEIRSLAAFNAAVTAGNSIICNEDGSWDCRWNITQLVRRFFGWEKDDTLNMARFFKKHLRNLETPSEAFTNTFSTYPSIEITQAIDAIKVRLRPYIEEETAKRRALKASKATILAEKAALPVDATDVQKKTVQAKLKELQAALKQARRDAHASRNIKKLEKHSIALQLRSTLQEEITARVNPTQEADEAWLKEKLGKWKSRQFPAMSSLPSDDESRRITETCSLKEIIDLCKQDPHYRENYFRFVFRNSLGACENREAVDIATQFPTIQKRITKAFLDKRVKRLKNNGIRFHQVPPFRDGAELVSLKKDVTFLINKEHKSLVKDSAVIDFGSGTVKTIRQLFKEEFEEKDTKTGEFEYLADGIVHSFPQLPRVDLTKQDYWKELPEWETLTTEQLQARYPDANLAHGLIVVKASRQHQDLRVDGTHAWLEVATPKGDGTFAILSFGKLANVFPKGIVQLFFYIFQTKQGIISYPDENEVYSHRQHHAVPLEATGEQIGRLLEKVRTDMLRARDGNFIFQAQGDNCASWVQETIEEAYRGIELPKVFDVEFLQTVAPFPISLIINGLRKVETISKKGANSLRILVSMILGAGSGIRTNDGDERSRKSLHQNHKWREGIQALPAKLFETGTRLQEVVRKNLAERV